MNKDKNFIKSRRLWPTMQFFCVSKYTGNKAILCFEKSFFSEYPLRVDFLKITCNLRDSETQRLEWLYRF